MNKYPAPSSTHSAQSPTPDQEEMLAFYRKVSTCHQLLIHPTPNTHQCPPPITHHSKQQCESNEAQINQLVQSIADLDPAYSELSKARRLVEEKTTEVTRLHDYASSLNTAIICEKEKGLNLQGEVERLRVVEMELNRENERLVERVGGGRGVMREEVTFYRDCRPERLRKSGKPKNSTPGKSITNSNQSALASPARSIRGKLGPQASPASTAALSTPPRTPASSSGKEKTPVHHAHTAHNASRQVLRTVYLPNERADALVLMVESLSSQLEEHKNLAKLHRKTIAEEFRDREENYKARISEDQAMIETLSNRCDEVERKWRTSVQNENAANHKLLVNERLEAERNVEANNVLKKVREEREELASQLEKNRHALKSHSQVHHRNLLHQVSEREKDVHTLREQYRDLQKVYDEKLESLEHKLQQSKEKFKSLEERRKVEIASFQKDISFFKNNIRQLERELMIKKKEEVAGGRSRTGSTLSLSRGRSASNVSENDETSEKQRNANIIRHITEYDYNPEELPENASFYGGLSGQLHTDVHKLKSKVQSLAKEINSDNVDDLNVSKAPGSNSKSPKSVSKPKGGGRRRSGGMTEVETTSARRGSYFGSTRVESESLNLVETGRSIMDAWEVAGAFPETNREK